MQNYVTVKSNGFITYCDALIARANNHGGTHQSFLFSLVGSPTQVQAASAHFFNGGDCLVSGSEIGDFYLSRWRAAVHSIRAKKIDDVVNKVLISAEHFPGANRPVTSAVVFGPDMDTVKERAFIRLNNSTTIPMKPEWREWLWEEILNPEKLFSFGRKQLKEAWIVCWDEEALEGQILEGVRQHYLL